MDGATLFGAARVPSSFQIEGMPTVCRLDPNTLLPISWSKSEGAWAYFNETSILGLPAALEPEGIVVEDDPLELLGLSISDQDTTIVFPSEFGIFDRFDLDRGPVDPAAGGAAGFDDRRSVDHGGRGELRELATGWEFQPVRTGESAEPHRRRYRRLRRDSEPAILRVQLGSDGLYARLPDAEPLEGNHGPAYRFFRRHLRLPTSRRSLRRSRRAVTQPVSSLASAHERPPAQNRPNPPISSAHQRPRALDSYLIKAGGLLHTHKAGLAD